jgi:hypothetical protein
MRTAHIGNDTVTIEWRAVAGVQQIVYVAKSEGKPIAILEKRPGVGFTLTTCGGRHLGDFATFEECEQALEQWMTARTLD